MRIPRKSGLSQSSVINERPYYGVERPRSCRSASLNGVCSAAHVVFVGAPAHGHVNPTLGIVAELVRRDATVDLRTLAAVLIQAEKFGSSVAQALRTQSDAMRTRRRQIAEEKAAKTAVKLIFPLVVFIFPSIFVVILGPASIKIFRSLLQVMK